MYKNIFKTIEEEVDARLIESKALKGNCEIHHTGKGFSKTMIEQLIDCIDEVYQELIIETGGEILRDLNNRLGKIVDEGKRKK